MSLILLEVVTTYLHNNHLYELSGQMHLLVKSLRIFTALFCESDCGQTDSYLDPTLEKLWFNCVLLALLACARSNLHLWLWISELKIFWGFSNILAITCQVLGGTRPTQSDFLSDFLIIVSWKLYINYAVKHVWFALCNSQIT